MIISTGIPEIDKATVVSNGRRTCCRQVVKVAKSGHVVAGLDRNGKVTIFSPTMSKRVFLTKRSRSTDDLVQVLKLLGVISIEAYQQYHEKCVRIREAEDNKSHSEWICKQLRKLDIKPPVKLQRMATQKISTK